MDVNLNDDKETCDICDKKFWSVAALDRHKKTHRLASHKLSCTECGVFVCRTREELRGHLESEHGITVETKEIEFDSMEQFLQWKVKMESDEGVFFTKRTGERMVDSEKSRLYYICHHSRTAIKNTMGKRLRASTKIDHTCPASLTVTKVQSHKVSVKFYTTHTGHNFSVSPVRHTYADTSKVAGQIVHVPSSTDGAVVLEYNATTWQQDLKHRSPEPVSVTMEQNDAMLWQQDVQPCTPVPVNAMAEEADAVPWQQEPQHSTPDFCGNMDSRKALCENCGISFTFRKDLYRHLRVFHDMDINLNEDKETCDICDKKFPSVAALDRHKKMHRPAPQKLSCTECGVFLCRTREELRGHLESEHGITVETKEMEFDSMEQFLQWKLKMESDERVFFTKRTGERMVDSEKSRLYYICHHSRTAMKNSVGKRLRASTKIDQTCPASMTVTKMLSSKVIVKFYMTHTGHNFFAGPLRRTRISRAMLADEVVNGRQEINCKVETFS